MLSKERAIFSVGYVGSVLGTLYAALIIKSYLLSIFFCGIQVNFNFKLLFNSDGF